ncbi:alpha/beta hydrolase [Marivirga sp. S37H4]|uniref:Alpha/beta hydrolase n=1 Tax=Marivirga aurantiaca TaxID=2802615 RepID=A0A934WWK8_9BACT|nr:alpha/beta hydrolase [Marivirga aurantiaca]MBK6264423.1 alpha/beta hydrolase [Marivirga aurantiaca]
MKSLYKKIILVILSLIIILIAVFLMGPKIKEPEFSEDIPTVETDLNKLDEWVQAKEIMAGEIKPDNEARIVWQDSTPSKTEYALVYLHGFGASHKEGFPVNLNLADSLDANLYLARLKGHGLVAENAFEGITAEKYMQSALEALAIGQQLGEKVILMGTSTGGAQALYMASQFPEKVHALILYSPYIELRDNKNAELVIGPWGKQITKWTLGGEISTTERPDSVAAYWSTFYHVDGYYSLFSMIDITMRNETFNAIDCPVFLAYYYKNETEQDNVVSVEAMNEMFAQLNSNNKKKIAFPETGDHVIASSLRSKDWRSVQDSSWAFLKELN